MWQRAAGPEWQEFSPYWWGSPKVIMSLGSCLVRTAGEGAAYSGAEGGAEGTVPHPEFGRTSPYNKEFSNPKCQACRGRET